MRKSPYSTKTKETPKSSARYSHNSETSKVREGVAPRQSRRKEPGSGKSPTGRESKRRKSPARRGRRERRNSRPREDYLPWQRRRRVSQVELRACCVATRFSYRMSPAPARKQGFVAEWKALFQCPELAPVGTGAETYEARVPRQ